MLNEAIAKLVELLKPDQATFIIAIIGCATGVISCAVHVYNAIQDHPKLKIERLSEYFATFFTNDSEQFVCKHVLLVHCRLNSKANIPMSIKRIEIRRRRLLKEIDVLEYRGIYHVDELRCGEKDKNVTTLKTLSHATLPLRLDGMEIRDCTLAFPFSDKLYAAFDAAKNRGAKMKIVVRFYWNNKHKDFRLDLVQEDKEDRSLTKGPRMPIRNTHPIDTSQ